MFNIVIAPIPILNEIFPSLIFKVFYILNTKYKDSSFDLLSIDVEGHELEVLKGFNLVKFSPNVIVVEYLDLNVSKLNKMVIEEFYDTISIKRHIYC